MSLIIVSGAIANKVHNGGEAWVRLSWVRGLRQLGHRVHFLEQIAPTTCVDPDGNAAAFEECVPLAYFREVAERFGLAGEAALIYDQGGQVYGSTWPELLDLAASADLLVNISGHLTLEPLLRRIRRKVYVDIDPGFTQFWHADPQVAFRLAGHDLYFTIGENLGEADCPIPSGGMEWRTIRQPVVLEDWPVRPTRTPERFTTLANWRGPFGPVQFGGRTYGLKVHEFRRFLPLPRRAPGEFELALNIHPADAEDREALEAHGWRLTDPRPASADPDAFRRYVQNSGAEFSVAQGIYVDTNSGWFSDRTVRYLASGKPALVQDTGFSRNLPVGEGLLAIRTLEEAIAGAQAIIRDYERHSRAARAVAEEFFDSDRVLGRLVEEAGITP
jgi:hypothetical protein